MTGMVDLTRRNGKPRARLLDLVLGRSGKAYADWLRSRGSAFTAGIGTATLDPFRGYATRSATSWTTPLLCWTPSTWSASD
jgi:transposase